MPYYYHFTSPRTNRPDSSSLLSTIRTVTNDPTAGVNVKTSQSYTVKSQFVWAPETYLAVQDTLDTARDWTPQTYAQQHVDQWPLEIRALIAVMVNDSNLWRSRLGLSALTTAQFLQTVRDRIDVIV